MKNTRTISWFSAGVSSAVATKLAIAEIDEVIYTHIDDQHSDTMRFVKDCEAWFGKPVTVLQSPYKTVENAVRANGGRFWRDGGTVHDEEADGRVLFIRQPARRGGAPCTRWLKQRVRKEWELQHNDKPIVYLWGMDAKESKRADGLREVMPEQTHRFPLIERGIGKAEAHEILKASGINRPAMYNLGYHNNNCVGCVKGGMGYWNHIRVDFPDVFAARARFERLCGTSILHKGKDNLFLDELDPQSGRHEGPICDDCGIMCELQRLI
jgi:hypothetical protein